MAATRESIERTLRAINETENSPTFSTAEKSAAVDTLSAPDVHGWGNGNDRGDRKAEREFESLLFSRVPDYRREFEQIVIDPPRAAFTWRITGTDSESEMDLDVSGATVACFDDDSRIKEFWLYYHDPLA